MTIYELWSDANRVQNLFLPGLDDAATLAVTSQVNGAPIAGNWVRPRVAVLRDGKHNKALTPSDFPSLYGVIPVFSARAVSVLRDELASSGELLDLVCDEGEYFAFNVTRFVDCLDEPNSDLIRFKDGRVVMIKRYAFLPQTPTLVGASSIFRLPQNTPGVPYVTEAFVEKTKKANLAGFLFRPT